MVSTTSDARDTGNDQRVSGWDENPGMDQWFPTTNSAEDTNLTSFSMPPGVDQWSKPLWELKAKVWCKCLLHKLFAV